MTLKTLLSAGRIHQWVKNLLIFAPIVLGGAIGDNNTMLKATLCFVAFGLLASATYLINDLNDVANDRLHPIKCKRPIASGALHPASALALAVIGIACGLAVGAAIGPPVFLGLLGYLALTLAYSLRLKRMPIADATTLGGLYTWRLFVGVLVSGVALSAWLLVFSFAFFFSLSLAKRYAEIRTMIAANRTLLDGRGYRIDDAPFVLNLGISAGVSSVLIFVLYMIEGAFRAAVFTLPEALWACPVILLLWICRIWMLAGRGQLHEDPVEFAVKDPKSLLLGGIGALVVLVALLA